MSIKWIHNNKRSVTVFVIVTAVVLSMSLFGVDIPSSRQQRYAIKIGEEQISFDEFQKEKRQRQEMLIEQYKKMLGDNYTQFVQQIYNMPNQEIVDDIISKELFRQEAKDLNLYVGEQQLANFIKLQVFGGNFSSSAYAAYLSQVGLSARGFEQNLREDLILDNYRSLLSDFAEPSMEEIKQFIKQNETLYGVSYIELDPASFEDKVKLEDAELEKFYTSNQTDYEIPAQVSYNYIDLNPAANMDLVEISPEDVEFYYSENETQFTTPEQVKVRHIQLNIPKDAPKSKLDEIKAKAEEIHSRVSAGESFELLVPQYSEDMLTSANGGDLGWLEKGKMDSRFDEAVFALKGKGLAPIIETDYAYQIAKVEDYKEPSLKPLEDVRAQITAELKKREAPAFISAKGHELFASWEEKGGTLAELAASNKLALQSSNGLLTAVKDPSPALKGLTETVLNQQDLKRQIIEIGDRTVLAEMLEFKEAVIPPFSEAREKVVTAYKKQEAVKLAEEAAENHLKALRESDIDLQALAKQEKLKVEEANGISRAKPATGVLGTPALLEAVFSGEPGAKPEAVLKANGKFYLLKVDSVKLPSDEDTVAKLAQYKEQAKQNAANIILQSNLNRLKSETEVDVDSSLLVNQADV